MTIVEHTEGLVPGPGLYRMEAKVYHADPAPAPSLSSSIAKVIVNQSPEHARAAHPRLAMPLDADEDEAERKPTRPQEIGTAVHRIILGAGRDLTVIDAADYKTKEAQADRKAAYAEDGAPILRTDLAKAERSANRILAQIAAIPGCEGFATAPAEIVAIVRDRSGAWLRIMMDRVEIHDTHAIIWDLKTSSQSAAPQGLGRRVEQMDMETQAALYVRVFEALFPRLAGRVRFRWIFVETATPNALSVAEADNVGMTVGARKAAAAIHLWNRCTASGEWPGYPARIVRVEYPEWAEKRWIGREGSDPQLADVSYDLATSHQRPLDYGDAA